MTVLKKTSAALVGLSTAAILCVTAAWLTNHSLWYPAALAFSTVAAVVALWSVKRPPEEDWGDDQGDNELQIEELQRRLSGLEAEASRAGQELQRREKTLATLASSLRLFAESRVIVDRLAAVARSTGEENSLKVTQGVFVVAERGIEFNKQMGTLLSDMFVVDESLDADVERLLAIVDRLTDVAGGFQDLGEVYGDEMEGLEKNVRDINEFTGEIGDLSDRTDVLAINASVAAARAGAVGKGFGVIAGGIRDLSTRSKEIAANINDVVSGLVKSISGAFELQRDRIQASVKIVAAATNELKSLSALLASQIKIVGMSLGESQEFGESVQDAMGEVTVALQAEDATGQIVEHICALLRDVERQTRVAMVGAEVELDEDTIRQEAHEIARRHFSVAGEWAAIGQEPPTAKDSQGEAESDVTLF